MAHFTRREFLPIEIQDVGSTKSLAFELDIVFFAEFYDEFLSVRSDLSSCPGLDFFFDL